MSKLEVVTWKSVPDFEGVSYPLASENSVWNLSGFSVPTLEQIPSCSIKMKFVFIDFSKLEGSSFSHAHFRK